MHALNCCCTVVLFLPWYRTMRLMAFECLDDRDGTPSPVPGGSKQLPIDLCDDCTLITPIKVASDRSLTRAR